MSGFLVKPCGSNRMAELAHEEPERNAVLESQGNGRRDRVHHAAERASRLGHDDEDLARGAVLVHADREIAVVAGHRELVGDRLPLVRQAAALRDRGALLARAGLRAAVFLARRERLAPLGAVAVDRSP
jgi:hypothetical protein